MNRATMGCSSVALVAAEQLQPSVPTAKQYYFCEDPNCEVVYFGADDSVVSKSRLRMLVGVKEREGNAMLCYCFGVSRADFERMPSIRDFVVGQTKVGYCSCETSNPSGRCCLKDFPKTKG